jgi:tetrahydromethanopterin S-methyltransferase subunit E
MLKKRGDYLKFILNLTTAIAFGFIGFLVFGGIVPFVGYEGAGILIAIIFIILLTVIINLLIKINNNIEKLNQK